MIYILMIDLTTNYNIMLKSWIVKYYLCITWLLGVCANLGGGGLGGGFFFTGCWKPLSDFDCFNDSTFANLDWVLNK